MDDRYPEGRVPDFYTLRHTFITGLVRAGVAAEDAQEMARYSTISLKMDRYAHFGTRGGEVGFLHREPPRRRPGGPFGTR